MTTAAAEVKQQRWHLSAHGRRHRVEVTGSFTRTVTWFVDDRQIAVERSSKGSLQLKPGDRLDASHPTKDATHTTKGPPPIEEPDLGAMTVKFNALGAVKRATWQPAGGDAKANARDLLGTDGLDLDPEPGSAAAVREERIRRHPRRYAAVAVTLAVAKLVLPLVVGLLAIRLAVSIPWPDWNLPSVPLPSIDLPAIPWPDVDLPSIPFPDVQLPGWMKWLLDKAQFVWPVILALVLARAELRRRRQQDELKAKLKAEAMADYKQPAASPPVSDARQYRNEEEQDGRRPRGKQPS